MGLRKAVSGLKPGEVLVLEAYLSRETIHHLQHWPTTARIDKGTVLRRLLGRKRIGERPHPDFLGDIFKRVGK